MTTHQAARPATFGPWAHCHWCGTAYPAGTTGWPRTCVGCGEISYRNPLPVTVSLLPVNRPDGGQSLVVIRRTIEPGYGLLALTGVRAGSQKRQAAGRPISAGRRLAGLDERAS
jgi:hypothetical protein